MTATYDTTLPTNKDHVRFLIGDTDITNPRLSDEEILAVISEQTASGKSLKYFASAACLSALLSKWSSAGEGELEREVDDFRIRRGIDQSAYQAVQMRIKQLREQGSYYLSKKPRGFRILVILLISMSLPYTLTLGQEFTLISPSQVIVEDIDYDNFSEEEEEEEEKEEGEEEIDVSNPPSTTLSQSLRSSLSAAGWCQIVSSESQISEEDLSNDLGNIGCDIGLGLRLVSLYKSLSLVGVLGSKSVGIGIAHTILDSLNSTLTYSIALGIVAPFDSNGIYSDHLTLAIGTNIGMSPKLSTGGASQ